MDPAGPLPTPGARTTKAPSVGGFEVADGPAVRDGRPDGAGDDAAGVDGAGGNDGSADPADGALAAGCAVAGCALGPQAVAPASTNIAGTSSATAAVRGVTFVPSPGPRLR
jgi:hypothetical protein